MLLAPGKVQGRGIQAIFDFVPKTDLSQRRFHLAHARATVPHAVLLQGKGQVPADGERKRIGLLEDHAHAPAKRDQIRCAVEDVLVVQQNPPAHGARGDEVRHAVEAGQEAALAATR